MRLHIYFLAFEMLAWFINDLNGFKIVELCFGIPD